MSDREIVARIGHGVRSFDPGDWDRCAGDDNPFTTHVFLSALEESGSVGGHSGWQPLPIAIDGFDGQLAAVMPAYGKSHSQGEYVFDHGWASAYERAGGDYYPKLQIAVPFSPITGRRLLASEPSYVPKLIAAAEAVVRNNRLSSAHSTFIADDEIPLFEKAGWLLRMDCQFHWKNNGFETFEDFLGTLASRKRKSIRKERREALKNIEIQWITGSDISETHWDSFWHFYQDTGSRKWGHPYLTRSFFSLLGERMGKSLLLIFAMRGKEPIAGALNLIGKDRLYGRYWGMTAQVPYLHFEICYYQAIEFAIKHRLLWVEAGAQGEHKLMRGYRPVPTWSAHYIADPQFRGAVADYLEHERRIMTSEIKALTHIAPFRKSEDS